MNPSLEPSSTFRVYVLRNVEYALQLMRQSPSASDLNVILQALEFGMQLDEAWPMVRELFIGLAPRAKRSDGVILWRSVMRAGLEQAQRRQDDDVVLMLEYHVGLLCQRMGRFDQAIQHFQRTLALAQSKKERLWQVRSYQRLGYALRSQGKWRQAERMLLLAQPLMTEEDVDEQGYGWLVLGAIRLGQHRWEEAYQCFQRTLIYWRRVADEEQLAEAQVNLGLAAIRRGWATEAEMRLRSAIEVLERSQAPEPLAVAYMNLGMLLEHNRAEEALDYLLKAEKLFRTMQDRFRLARVAVNLGRTYYALDRWADAIHAFQFGMNLWRELKRPSKELNAAVGLAASYARQGDVARARVIIEEGMATLAQARLEVGGGFLEDMFEQVLEMIEASESG